VKRLALVSRRVEGLSGAARIILEEARSAVQAGWEVHVFGEKLDGDAVGAAGALPRRVLAWPWGSWLKRRSFSWAAERMTAGFDLVHGHGDILRQDLLSLHNCVHAACEAVKGEPLPAEDAVGRMHALQLSERRFRLMVANSRLMKDDVARRFGVPGDMIEVIYPGFDPSRFNPADRERLGKAFRSERGFSPEVVLFGLITSGDFEKRGLSVFLRAFAVLSRQWPTARALVVGKETRPGPYLRLAAELGISQKVSFLAPMPEVERIYHALDVYVHAAPWEEFGMTVLEALACGLPVLMGEKVGAAEILTGEARDGVLRDLSPEALPSAMLRLARNPELRARLAAEGPAAASVCSWPGHARAVLALYDRLVKK